MWAAESSCSHAARSRLAPGHRLRLPLGVARVALGGDARVVLEGGEARIAPQLVLDLAQRLRGLAPRFDASERVARRSPGLDAAQHRFDPFELRRHTLETRTQLVERLASAQSLLAIELDLLRALPAALQRFGEPRDARFDIAFGRDSEGSAEPRQPLFAGARGGRELRFGGLGATQPAERLLRTLEPLDHAQQGVGALAEARGGAETRRATRRAGAAPDADAGSTKKAASRAAIPSAPAASASGRASVPSIGSSHSSKAAFAKLTTAATSARKGVGPSPEPIGAERAAAQSALSRSQGFERKRASRLEIRGGRRPPEQGREVPRRALAQRDRVSALRVAALAFGAVLARRLARELDVGGRREQRALLRAERFRLASEPRAGLAAALLEPRDLARERDGIRERELAHARKIDRRSERAAAALPVVETAQERRFVMASGRAHAAALRARGRARRAAPARPARRAAHARARPQRPAPCAAA